MVESLASKIEQSGKNLALNTLWQREFELFMIRHTCLANNESLNFSISLKPKPPTSLASHKHFQFTQWTFQLSPLYPHQYFLIKTSNSFTNPLGSLKQLIVYVGIAWITDFIRTSLPA